MTHLVRIIQCLLTRPTPSNLVVTAFVLQAFVPGSSAMFAVASTARGPKYYTSPSATNQLMTMFKLCYAGFI